MPGSGRRAKPDALSHIMEHYSAFKRKDVVTQATTQVNLGDTVLSEMSQ